MRTNNTQILGCHRDHEHGVAVKSTLVKCRRAAVSAGSNPESLTGVLCEIWHVITAGRSQLEIYKRIITSCICNVWIAGLPAE